MALKTVTNCVGLFVFSARDNVICIACGQTRDFTHRIELNKTMTPYLFLRHLILALCLKIKNNLQIKAFVGEAIKTKVACLLATSLFRRL